jgi:hypothetical protein
MSDAATDIRAAERRSAAARARLTGTLHQLQNKLSPKVLARDAATAAATAGQNAAQAGLESARANPAPVAGAVALGGLFLFRKRIARLFRRKKKLKVPAQAKAPTNPDRGSDA